MDPPIDRSQHKNLLKPSLDRNFVLTLPPPPRFP